ncbi:MAG: hypothetical protein HOW73_43400 [Polyangiaceae bacterium]|nr:hypothetical protein [Polyangiaceae bacterium]
MTVPAEMAPPGPPCACSLCQRDVEFDDLRGRVTELEALINTPELDDFAKGVVLEAKHQRDRWGTEHDAGKEPADWFWLLGYLAGKAMKSLSDGDVEKAKHHVIASAAMLANWHAAITGTNTAMRPGIEAPATEAG